MYHCKCAASERGYITETLLKKRTHTYTHTHTLFEMTDFHYVHVCTAGCKTKAEMSYVMRKPVYAICQQQRRRSEPAHAI